MVNVWRVATGQAEAHCVLVQRVTRSTRGAVVQHIRLMLRRPELHCGNCSEVDARATKLCKQAKNKRNRKLLELLQDVRRLGITDVWEVDDVDMRIDAIFTGWQQDVAMYLFE